MSSDTVYSIGWNLLNVSTSMDNRRILNDRRITRDEVLSSLVNLRQLTFEVTGACNLQCKYCGYGDLYFGYDERETKCMAFERGRLLPRLSRVSVVHISCSFCRAANLPQFLWRILWRGAADEHGLHHAHGRLCRETRCA